MFLVNNGKMNLSRVPAAGAHQRGRMRWGKEKEVGGDRRKRTEGRSRESEGDKSRIRGGGRVEGEEGCMPEITCIHAARGHWRPGRKARGRIYLWELMLLGFVCTDLLGRFLRT